MWKDRLNDIGSAGGYALITGASSGIGYRMACELASAGVNLIAVSNRNAELAMAVHNISEKYGVEVIPVFLDLSEEDSALFLCEFCKGKGIVPKILVNNAGIFRHRDFLDQEAEDIAAFMRLHIFVPTMLARYFGEMMASDGGGYILNTASLAGEFSFPGISMYCSTKAYLRNLSMSLRHEFRKRGIAVTALCPGGVATDLYGLGPSLMKLALNLGVVARPERVVRKGLKGLMNGRKTVVPDRVMNKFFVVMVKMLPSVAVRKIYSLLEPLRK